MVLCAHCAVNPLIWTSRDSDGVRTQTAHFQEYQREGENRMDNYGDVDSKLNDTLMKQVQLMYNFVRDVDKGIYSPGVLKQDAHNIARTVRRLKQNCPYYPQGVIHE